MAWDPRTKHASHRYKPYVAARVTGKTQDEAEDLLVRYIDGGNKQRRRFELTTPLLRDSDGAVSLMVPGIQARVLLTPPASFACMHACMASLGCVSRLSLEATAHLSLHMHVFSVSCMCQCRMLGRRRSRRMQP